MASPENPTNSLITLRQSGHPAAEANPRLLPGVSLPEDYLAAILASCPDPIVGETADGTINFWNAAAERTYGYTAAEAMGHPVSILAQPDREAEMRGLLTQVQQGQVVEAYETVRQARDGRLLDVSLTIFPVRDESGRIIGASATTRDITQRKRDTAALSASERRFRTAFDDAPNGMALLDLEGDFLQVNRAGCELLGRSQAELLAMNVADVLHPDDVGKDDLAAERALSGEASGLGQEMRVLRPDGSVRWVRAQVSLVRDDDGQPASFIAQVQDVTESVTTHELLQATHHQMQEVLERLGGAFVEVDRDWRIVQTNAAADALLGQPRAVLAGQRLQDVMAVDALAPILGALQTTMTDRQRTQVTEFAVPPANAWFSLWAYPTDAGVSFYLRDITTLRRLERELQVAETRFQSLVEQLPGAVYMHADDAEHTTLYLSPYFEQLAGDPPPRSLAPHTYASWVERVHPQDRARVVRENVAHISQPGQYLLEYRYRCADGSYIWVHNIYAAIRDDAGQVVAWLGIIIDTTAQREADAAIARLAAIVEGSDDAIYSRTLDGFITYWSPAAERLYGYSADEMLGQPATRLFVDETDHVDTTPEALASGIPQRFEAQDRRKDGSIVDVAANMFPVCDAAGNVTGISGIARDITARIATDRELRAALEAAEAGVRAKGQFLAMMSHELRTPLQAVLGYADFLLSGRQGDLTEEQVASIRSIHLGASRMVSLIEQMLDLSRMEAGRLELKSERVDIRRVLEQVRQEIAPQVTAWGLGLTLTTPPRLPRVLGDPERVRQILLNLAGNAVKFTEAGEIGLHARARPGWVEVAVTDTGVGITSADLPHVFEEFRQVDSNLSRRHGGAGLGLAIARRLAEQMGGTITVVSQPGAGSTFTLRLPVAPRRRAGSSAAS